MAFGLGVLATIGIVSVALAPDAGAPQRPAARAHSTTPGPTACANADGKGSGGFPVGFPVGARIRGGPGAYRNGDDFQEWAIELSSRASVVCRRLHPVVVLVDRKRVLQPAQIRLEFHDGTRWRPVRMVHTDRDENVGAFDSFPGPPPVFGPSRNPGPPPAPGTPGFSGFTLWPGATLTVRVRLALAAGAESDDVVAVAVIVQRRGGDGDWVGESGRYPFTIGAGD